MKFNFSLDAALIITALTALLYLVAQVFLAGYISIFGADITVLNLTVQDKLYYGFLKSLVHTLYFTLALFVLFIAVPSIFNNFGGNIWLHKKLQNLRIAIHKDTKHRPVIHNSSFELKNERQFNRKLFASYFILVLLLGSVKYLSYIETEAKQRAQNDLMNYSEKLRKVQLKSQENQEAYKILCGQNLCAVLMVNGKQKSLHYIDPKDIAFFLN